MLQLGFPRALVISTLTLAATLAAGAAQAEPPPPPALPAAATPPNAAPAPTAAPIDAKHPAKPGRVYTPPGHREPPEESAPADDSTSSARTPPRSHAVAPGFQRGYGSPPPAYGLPQSDAILPEQQPEYPPETQMRSPGLVAGGVVLLSFGVVGLFAGSAMVGAHEPTGSQPNVCTDCSFDGSGGTFSAPSVKLKPGFAAAGIGTLIGSVVAIGVSIPLIVIGAKKVPHVTKEARLTPSIGVGPASATLRWQF